MSYQEALENIGEVSSREMLARYEDYRAGRITLQQFKDMAITVIALANEQGRIMAELSYSAWLQSTGREPYTVAAAAVGHYRNTERMGKAIDTIMGGVEDTADMRLQRLAYGESVESSQRAFHSAMETDEVAGGWVRGLDSKPCQLCRWWYRDGRVWPISHEMPTHTGCTCNPIPTEEPAVPLSRRRR